MDSNLEKKISKISKRISFLTKVPKILARNSFKTILLLFIISLIFGYFIYYKYFLLIASADPVITEDFISIKEESFRKVLEEWENRERIFQEVNTKEYSSFMKIKLTEGED